MPNGSIEGTIDEITVVGQRPQYIEGRDGIYSWNGHFYQLVGERPLQDANWIIDILVGGISGLWKAFAVKGGAQGIKSLGAAANTNRTLQTGGNILNNSTLKALGLTKEQGRNAIHALKEAHRIPPNAHYKIMKNGDIINPHTGKFIDNLFDYVY